MYNLMWRKKKNALMMVSDNSKYTCVATLFCLHVLMFPGDKQYTQIV